MKKLDDLQRALEGELVGFLKAQNSKLMSELADLKSQLQKGSSVPANSGTGSTPWSAVDVTSEESSRGASRVAPAGRPGRDGSRTPRSKIREHAASPWEMMDV